MALSKELKSTFCRSWSAHSCRFSSSKSSWTWTQEQSEMHCTVFEKKWQGEQFPGGGAVPVATWGCPARWKHPPWHGVPLKRQPLYTKRTYTTHEQKCMDVPAGVQRKQQTARTCWPLPPPIPLNAECKLCNWSRPIQVSIYLNKYFSNILGTAFRADCNWHDAMKISLYKECKGNVLGYKYTTKKCDVAKPVHMIFTKRQISFKILERKLWILLVFWSPVLLILIQKSWWNVSLSNLFEKSHRHTVSKRRKRPWIVQGNLQAPWSTVVLWAIIQVFEWQSSLVTCQAGLRFWFSARTHSHVGFLKSPRNI